MSIVIKGANVVLKAFKDDAKQYRFASAVALTRTAKLATEDQKKAAEKQLDRPTPFTKRGFRWRKATKRNLESAVYVAPIQAGYLWWEVEGGRRRKRSKGGEVLPVNIKLNQYGNIPGRNKGKIKKLMDQPETFTGWVRGVYGIWQRGHYSKHGNWSLSSGRRIILKNKKAGKVRTRGGRASTIRLLARFEPYVTYKKKPLKFYETAARTYLLRYNKEFEKALAFAVRTAR